MKRLHLRCGSDIRQTLIEAKIEGDFLEFADPFCIGPLPPLSTTEQTIHRASFLANAFALDEQDTLARMQREYGALESLQGYPQIVLWFEHDSYDQLILAYLLKRLGEMQLTAQIELIAIDHAPGIERFIGLGQLNPEQLKWAWQQREPVTTEQFALGNAVWPAITDASPERLHTLVSPGTAALPLMAPALLRHLQELPELQSGLSLSERLTLEIVRDSGETTIGRAFGELMRQREPLPYLGDTTFGWIVQGLSEGESPALAVGEPQPDRPWYSAPLQLTEWGEGMLEGSVNRLDLHPPTRWVGGVRIPCDDGTWCWSAPAQRPVWRGK